MYIAALTKRHYINLQADYPNRKLASANDYQLAFELNSKKKWL